MQELLEKKKETFKRRKEEQERRDQLGSSHGKGNLAKGGLKGDNKGKKGGGVGGASLRNEDSEVQIPPKLREVIEESDDEYPLYFRKPEELLEMFATLEEKNLFLIQQGQEAEQVLETKKHEFEKLKKEFS